MEPDPLDDEIAIFYARGSQAWMSVKCKVVDYRLFLELDDDSDTDIRLTRMQTEAFAKWLARKLG